MTPHERLEEQLRNALRRKDAPPGFAERVMACVQQQHAPVSLWQRFTRGMNMPAFRYAAVAALCVAIVVGSLQYRRHEQEERAGEAAKQQLMLALRITGSKLHYVQAKVNNTNSQQFVPEQHEGDEQQ